VAPTTAFLIDETDEDFFALNGMEIGNDRSKVFAIVAGGFEDDLLIVGANEFDASVCVRASRDQKRGKRLSHFK
jgi:hypothetical protein